MPNLKKLKYNKFSISSNIDITFNFVLNYFYLVYIKKIYWKVLDIANIKCIFLIYEMQVHFNNVHVLIVIACIYDMVKFEKKIIYSIY
jgi:hypothetical protein